MSGSFSLDGLRKFPITGEAVCSVLVTLWPERKWSVKGLETLSSKAEEKLGQLWRQVQSGETQLTTQQICEALQRADQVITLDICLVGDESRELLIEDGTLFSCSLSLSVI